MQGPHVMFCLPSNFCVSDSTRNDCFCYIHSTDTIWRVSSCISLVNYFSRESISRHSVHPSVCLSYLPPRAPPSKRTPKIFMCTDIGLQTWSNRSHRTRECRGSINIGPPGQIVFGSNEKKERKKICHFGNARRGRFTQSRTAANSHEFQRSRRRGKLIGRECVAARSTKVAILRKFLGSGE